EKIEEELGEVKQAMASRNEKRIKSEIGDLIFAVVNLSRFQRISAEVALESAVNRFVGRFKALEARVRSEGRKVSDCTIEELEAHWQAVKKSSSRRVKPARRKQRP
ncbi:MAG: MazG nucleotide pyrophosphohydrolase domain-containing protein, partial [bacterium]